MNYHTHQNPYLKCSQICLDVQTPLLARLIYNRVVFMHLETTFGGIMEIIYPYIECNFILTPERRF